MRQLVIILGWAAVAAQGADFNSEIAPLLEARCLLCHSDANPLGNLSIETRESAIRGGASGPSIVVGNPRDSLLIERMALPAGAPGAMPPAGPQTTDTELAALRDWISDGADWERPLQGGPAAPTSELASDELALVQQIHALVSSRPDPQGPAAFEAYDEAVPGTDTILRMVPIPAGEFVMGTPIAEPGRGQDEAPQVRVRLDAFWMGAHEVSWDAFRRFMLRESEGFRDPDTVAAAVSSPTPPYVEMSFGMGIQGYPAISMTQHAASKYAQWLTAKTGHFYRLPTEAEWEYACRAGTTTAYSFGDSAEDLAQHAWFWDNSGAQYQPIGMKMPNAWGLFDMHGNVWEWTLDQYAPAYPTGRGPQVNPWQRATSLYPRVARGGSWMEDAPSLRCGARRASSEDWKMQDPQLPKSIWYHTDAQWLGFRLVRPAKIPTAEEMHAYWNSATGAM